MQVLQFPIVGYYKTYYPGSVKELSIRHWSQILGIIVSQFFISQETALYIYKTREKKRTEAAIDLAQATVFVEYESSTVVGKMPFLSA